MGTGGRGGVLVSEGGVEGSRMGVGEEGLQE